MSCMPAKAPAIVGSSDSASSQYVLRSTRLESTAAGTGIDFVASGDIEKAAKDAGVDKSTTDAIIDGYEQAQLVALKAGLVAAALLALASLAFTGDLPHDLPAPDDQEAEPAAA